MNAFLLIPRICHGKPVIRRHACASGESHWLLGRRHGIGDAQKDFDLAPEDVRTALDYAAELLNQEQHHPLPV